MESPRPTKLVTPFSRTRKIPSQQDDTSNSSYEENEAASSSSLSTTTRPESSLGYLFNRMSLQERSTALEDLHGVSDKINETPEMIQTKTIEMTNALNEITANIASTSPSTSTSTTTTTGVVELYHKFLAFQKAMEKSPEYVESLKIRFLRAESYNSVEAANRMIRFFDEKMKYFGESKLVDEIRYEDLGDQEVEALERGLFQLLPLRDQAGRILFMVKGDLNIQYPNNYAMTRLFFYFLMAIHKDEEHQKCGTVLISYSVGQKIMVPGRFALFWKIWSALPIRHSGFHGCVMSTVSTVTAGGIAIVSAYFDKYQLGRTRVHFGSDMECIYNLMTFGIPRDAIPIRDDGTMDLTEHHRMLKILKYRENQDYKTSRRKQQQQEQQRQQKKIEQSQQQKQEGPRHSSEFAAVPPPISTEIKTSIKNYSHGDLVDPSSGINNQYIQDKNTEKKQIILVPGPMDVLLGQGRRQSNRPGMIRLNNLLEEHYDAYNNPEASRFEKTVISKLVFQVFKESNCRLLRPIPEEEGGGFEECDDDIAHDRISHSFRTLRQKKKTKNSRNNTGGNTNSNNKKNKTARCDNNSNKRLVENNDFDCNGAKRIWLR